MKYLFILGRNPELSVREIESYLKRTENKILDIEKKDNSALIETENPLDAGAVEFLGGTIAIGIVMCRIKEIDRKEVYMGEKNNFSYAIWNFSEHTEEVSEYLKSRFRSEKLKASEKKLRETIDMQDGNKGQSLSSKTEEEYFVYKELFGKIIQKCDYKKIEDRDMKKPVRRESLSISPRLAKIMINLSEVRENEVLLDAFCGIGVILSEALIQNIKVFGIDKDRNAIEGCIKNLKWAKFSESDYKIINDDSSKAKINREFRGMASEPDFGETLKKLPKKEETEAMTRRYENIMISVLKNLNNKIKGKIVFSSPIIKTHSGRIKCNAEKIASSINRKISEGFPIAEFREGQIVGREIIVLE